MFYMHLTCFVNNVGQYWILEIHTGKVEVCHQSLLFGQSLLLAFLLFVHPSLLFGSLSYLALKSKKTEAVLHNPCGFVTGK